MAVEIKRAAQRPLRPPRTSAWLAARLVRAAEPGRNFGAALLIGELIKVGLVAALFAVLFAKAGEANAPALLLGFVAAVQGYFLAMLFK